MRKKQNNSTSFFHGFGWLVQAIVGSIQGTALAVGDAIEYDRQKKYLKDIKQSQDILYGTLLENKKKELAHKEEMLQIQGQTEILRDQKIKKLVIIGGITAVGVTIVALIAAYAMVGKEKGKVIKVKEL